MKNQNFYMRVISLLLVVLAVLFYNSSMKAQANEKEISALTDKVDTLQEQQNELLSALETSYANRMQNQAASTGTDSSNADSTDGDKAAAARKNNISMNGLYIRIHRIKKKLLDSAVRMNKINK